MTAVAARPPRAVRTSPGRRLMETMAAVRVSFVWMGIRRSLSPDQKAQAAEPFGAESGYLSAAKKILDTKHPAFQAVTAVKNQIVSYWRSMTVPYPEPGVRLIHQEHVTDFNARMAELHTELQQALTELSRCYSLMREDARTRLGSLFNPEDYPPNLDGLFDCVWDFPSVEPPDYLRHLNPALYQEESRRIAARFDEAVQMAQDAFVAEFSRLVAHLAERITGTEDGKPKTFRDSAVRNLREFFERFRMLDIRSSQQLDDLVASAQRMLQGVQPQDLRDSQALRTQFAGQLATVQRSLDELLVDRPRRRIIRSGDQQAAA